MYQLEESVGVSQWFTFIVIVVRIEFSRFTLSLYVQFDV